VRDTLRIAGILALKRKGVDMSDVNDMIRLIAGGLDNATDLTRRRICLEAAAIIEQQAARIAELEDAAQITDIMVKTAIAERIEANGRAEALSAKVAELEKLVYVPGVLRCAKCSLRLVSTIIDAGGGRMASDNSPHQCPNGCGPMWRLTERQAGNELCDQVDALTDKANRAEAAEAVIATYEKANKAIIAEAADVDKDVVFAFLSGKDTSDTARMKATIAHLSGQLGREIELCQEAERELAAAKKEAGFLRAALRVNTMRSGATNEEIDALLKKAKEHGEQKDGGNG